MIPGWIFTDQGFIAGGQAGAFRIYGSPSEVLESPWDFPDPEDTKCIALTGGLFLRMEFENDAECPTYHDPPFNDNTQTATASAVITVAPGCQALMTVNWCGRGEEHQVEFERMTNRVDGLVVANAHSPGTIGQQCASGMGDAVVREGWPGPPREISLSPGFHILEITTTTGDEKYHWAAYYEFEFTVIQQ